MGESQSKPTKANIKSYCQMAVSRMNINKKKKQNEISKKRQEVANLLKSKNEELARIKVEGIIREENMIIVYDILSMMCDVCAERAEFLADFKQQESNYREIPPDMWPHLQTIFYCGDRIDIEELQKFTQTMKERCKNIGNDLINVNVKSKLELCLYDYETKTNKLLEIAKQFQVEFIPVKDTFEVSNLINQALRQDFEQMDENSNQIPNQQGTQVVITTGNSGQIEVQIQQQQQQQHNDQQGN